MLKLKTQYCNLCGHPVSHMLIDANAKRQKPNFNESLFCYLCIHDIIDMAEFLGFTNRDFDTSILYEQISPDVHEMIPWSLKQLYRIQMQKLKSRT